MHIDHDRESDTAYVSLVAHIADGTAVRQIPVDGLGADAEVFLDVDASGRLLGIEVIGAGGALPVEVLEQASTVEHGTPGPAPQ
ncbi:DUF2283 domain-containing protein [Streptomyces sp. NEAU-H22]|uniref:DUF2283 domain-containing protein n=1 Tax=unclassified Streptomyces TaxID=2593676 RepID=UPI00224E53AD|nr:MULTISPECIES: DUF2283 domain-containing protein [unclassified Streptomyces]MCX3285234.1 DUF2283 domain-containing protein [Streptomyces sp. NEAU-H22]WMD03927.1 DUF2283 domain-containing protein [Streptomyces sp. FXY-T5]